MLRQFAVDSARSLGLLPLVERLRFQLLKRQSAATNAAISSADPSFPYPPLDVFYDAHGRTSFEGYRESGLFMANFIYKLTVENLPESPAAIAEWGCGPGRIIRHMRAVSKNDDLRVIGADYNERSISWASSAIDGVEFLTNSLAPPLPLADDSVDCLYSTSVYTHLSEAMHFAWFEDNIRVVRPNGLVIFTTHGDFFRQKLLKQEKVTYDSGELVIRSKVKEGARAFVCFHPPSFIKDVLISRNGCDLCRHLPSPDPRVMGGQDVWIVRVG
jgi:SAM-dependent methyltransferase